MTTQQRISEQRKAERQYLERGWQAMKELNQLIEADGGWHSKMKPWPDGVSRVEGGTWGPGEHNKRPTNMEQLLKNQAALDEEGRKRRK